MTSVTSETVSTTQTMIQFGDTNNVADNVNLGIFGVYNGGNNYSGLIRKGDSSGEWVLFNNSNTIPFSTANNGVLNRTLMQKVYIV